MGMLVELENADEEWRQLQHIELRQLCKGEFPLIFSIAVLIITTDQLVCQVPV
jgi:hypothetical protein